MKLLTRQLNTVRNQQSGFILPVLLVTGVMLVLIIAAVSSETIDNNRLATHGNYAVEAQMAADAGLDEAINKMNTVADWAGTGGDVTLLNDATRDLKTTYAVVVNPGVDDSHKTLIVTAKTYFPASAAEPRVTRKYAMDIEAVTSGNGSTSVSSGVGGLILDTNAKISGGDVVVNGKITMSNNSQIGLSTNPVNVRVADQVCPNPPDANYPRVCDTAEGDSVSDPIVMGANSKIYADVIATNQTDGTNMTNTGLEAGQRFDPVPLPTFDRAAFKSTITTSLTNTAAQTCSGGVVSWPAGVHITGGDITLPNNCTVKINGNVWIDGSLSFKNNAKLVVQDSLGTTVPDVVVDGSGGITISNNGEIVPNTNDTGAEILTFWSAAACSPDCADVSGADLANSQNVATINLSNNGSAPNSVLYAYWSKISISNNGAIGAVAGQTVQLSNNAVINFTASVPGSDNLITTWVKRGYMRLYS